MLRNERNKSRVIDKTAEVGYSRGLLHGSSPPILGTAIPCPFFCLEVGK